MRTAAVLWVSSVPPLSNKSIHRERADARALLKRLRRLSKHASTALNTSRQQRSRVSGLDRDAEQPPGAQPEKTKR